MSRKSDKRQVAGGDPRLTSKPEPGPRLARGGSLFLLVLVVAGVTAMMVVSLVRFVAEPDPTVRAGPTYVTLALTTGAMLLMLALALNASYLPLLSRARVNDMSLVMWTMLAIGVVTGMLTLGGDVTQYAGRLVVAAIAFTFITVQHGRLAKARAGVPAAQTDTPAGQTDTPAGQTSTSAAEAQPHPRRRQRRGGRKH